MALVLGEDHVKARNGSLRNSSALFERGEGNVCPWVQTPVPPVVRRAVLADSTSVLVSSFIRWG